MKKAPKLTNEERSEIQILKEKGYSARSIASALGRSPNTIASELKRNSYKDGRYISPRAKHKAYVRRKYAKHQGKKIEGDKDLRSFIVAKLKKHWNPSEISGFMKRHQDCTECCQEADCTEQVSIVLRQLSMHGYVVLQVNSTVSISTLNATLVNQEERIKKLES